MLKKLLSTLLIISILLPQKTYEFTEEEVQSLYTSIQELENSDSNNQKIIENLNGQIYMYIHSDSLYQSQIEQYEKQIELQKAMIKEVKPKWYDNKYLWFGYGVLSMILPVWAVGQVK
jgi:hypothetical protein